MGIFDEEEDPYTNALNKIDKHLQSQTVIQIDTSQSVAGRQDFDEMDQYADSLMNDLENELEHTQS
jgi:hypothetical protein